MIVTLYSISLTKNKMEWMNTIVSMVQNNEKKSENDVEEVIQEAEEILRCCIFKLLEKVIHQEVDNGQLDFSSLPEHITTELKTIKEYLIQCKNADNSGYLHHRIIEVMDAQLDCTLKRHHQTFYKLTASLDLSSEFNFAYESFVRIAKRFIDGEITWFRVVSLLCFGAELSVAVIKKGGPGVQGFIKRIVHYVTEFLLKEEVAEWISTHGGWVGFDYTVF